MKRRHHNRDSVVYRDRSAIWFVRGQAIFLLFLALILAVSSGGKGPAGHGPANTAIRVASVLVALATGVWLRYGVRRVASLEATPQGVTVGVFRRRFIRWPDIASFKAIRRGGLYSTVYLELTSGDLVSARMVQGRKMFWNGGASKDIVGVLNAELARSRTTETTELAEKDLSRLG